VENREKSSLYSSISIFNNLSLYEKTVVNRFESILDIIATLLV
jgi:hypothetical protein